MRRSGGIVLASLALAGAALANKLDPALVGSWTGVEIPVLFQVQSGGTCTIMNLQGTCATSAGKVTFTTSAGERAEYRYTIKGDLLTVTGPELPQPLIMRRSGASPAEVQPGAPRTGKAAGPSQSEPAAAAPSGKGTIFEKESWGVRLTVPAGWRAGEKDGMLLIGGESEAGLIIVRFVQQVSREAMLAEYGRGLHEQGINLMPSGPAQDWKAPGGQAVAGELAGSGPNGLQYRARAIGLFSRFGGGLIAFGLTTADKYATVKARTEAVAQSVSFKAVKAPKGADLLAGRYEYVYVAPQGGYTREAKITLCSDGRFSKGGEMSGSGSAGSAVTNHNNGGTWSSQGDALQGQITLSYNNGQRETLPYRVSQDARDRSAYGAAVTIGNTKYQKSGPGNCR